MKIVGIWLAVAALVALGGCSSTPLEELTGKAPRANGALFRQAETVVMDEDREAKPDCKSRSVVHRVLVVPPESTASPHGSFESVPFTGSGTPSSYVVPSGMRYSRFVERWTIARCDTEVNYLVTYTPEGSETIVTAELEK